MEARIDIFSAAQPAPLPPGNLPPNAPVKHLHGYRRMLRGAAYAIRREDELTFPNLKGEGPRSQGFIVVQATRQA